MLYEIALWIAAAGFSLALVAAVRQQVERLIRDAEERIREHRTELPAGMLLVATIGGRQRARAVDAVAGLEAGGAVAA